MTRWLAGACRRSLWIVTLVIAGAAAACATRTPPAGPSATVWRQPDVPRGLAADTANTSRYEQAWARIRRGDVRGGERELNNVWKSAPAFYPAAASLGELQLRGQHYRDAGTLFERALAVNPSYLPALAGLVDARLGARDDAAALTALERLLAVDPLQHDARGRLEAVRLRVSQSELVLAEKLGAAGQWDEAEKHWLRALEATPESGPVLRGLAGVNLARGVLDQAEVRARQAATLDPQDPQSQAILGDVLEAQGRYADAIAAQERAVVLDPRPARRERLASLRLKAQTAALPENYRSIERRASVTRADVAAVLGVRLAALVERAPAESTEVVTDVRGHWAGRWILPVVRAGWMDVRPNHTFQPSGDVNRADLARVVAAVLTKAGARGRGAEAPGGTVFADVPRDHAAYRAIALAVSAGIMTLTRKSGEGEDANRFSPAAAVSGAELFAIVTRLEARTR